MLPFGIDICCFYQNSKYDIGIAIKISNSYLDLPIVFQLLILYIYIKHTILKNNFCVHKKKVAVIYIACSIYDTWYCSLHKA